MTASLSTHTKHTNRPIAGLAAVGLLAAICLSGCRAREPRGRIFGKITYRGAAVKEGLVLFSNAAKGVYMTAKLQPDGSYIVLTAKGAGLPLGKYQIAFAPPLLEAPTGVFSKKPVQFPTCPNIPAKYRNPNSSGLSLEVRAGDNPFDVDMQPEAKQ